MKAKSQWIISGYNSRQTYASKSALSVVGKTRSEASHGYCRITLKLNDLVTPGRIESQTISRTKSYSPADRGSFRSMFSLLIVPPLDYPVNPIGEPLTKGLPLYFKLNETPQLPLIPVNSMRSLGFGPLINMQVKVSVAGDVMVMGQ